MGPPASFPRALARNRSACDSHAVFSGRGYALLAGVGASVAIAAVPAIGSADPVAHASKKPPLHFLKARVRSDGIVTPGQQEWVTLSELPPKAKFKMAIEPPATTPQCGQYYFCHAPRVFPVPGTPPYRTNGKGRALVSFVMPSTYVIESDPSDPSTRQTVAFADGQSVHIDVIGMKRTRKMRLVGFGFGRAIVQLPSE
jgi:hypothetical protein